MNGITTTAIGAADFKIFTGLLKTSRSNDGKMRLHGIASSTTKDLHGDTMSASAIDDMERAANNNLTIFLNHSYNIPEDVGGSVERASSVIRGVDQDGNPNVDLGIDILVNDANPRAVQVFEAIEHGTKLGLSIGAMVPEGGAKRNKNGSYLIEHVELLETSLVGIPANPRSWVEYAVKALRGKERTEDVVFGNGTTTNKLVFHLDGTGPIARDVVIPAAELAEAPPAETIEETIEKDVEPDITEAQITIEIDTSDGDAAAADDAQAPQEAELSQPEDGDGDTEATEPVTRSVTDLTSLTEATTLLLQATRDLMETRRALGDAEIAKATAVHEREQAQSERDRVLRETRQILDRVADSPLVRRATVHEANRSFRDRFGGVYSEDFLKTLEKSENE